MVALLLFFSKMKTKIIFIFMAVVFAIPLLYLLIKHFFSSNAVKDAQHQQSVSNGLYTLHVVQMQAIRNANSSLVYTRNDNDLINIARNIAIDLGTHKDYQSPTENETPVVLALKPLQKGDFILLQYLYKSAFTDNRELRGDLVEYLNPFQYNEISHLYE